MNGISVKDLIDCFEEFLKYVEEVEDIVLNKLPAIVESAMQLVEAVTGIVENAKGEIESLNAFEKVKAAAKAAVITKDVAKIPSTIKKMIEDFKE